MTVFYLDFSGGNDAADGTSFANRWKTFTNGPTAARVTAGDTVRVIASPDPNNIGSVTWTDNSSTLTLGAAKTLTISNCDTAWTASANVTTTAPTGDGHKISTACSAAAVASGFTTGKIAYLALGAALDLSTYEQVSFWFKTSVNVAAGVLELKLCSDAAGNTPVNTISLPGGSVAGTGAQWQIIVKDFATSLGASINSIALYAVSDPGTVTIRLSNMVACKAASSADCLTHLSLLGKNTVGEPEWYPILSIDGVALKFGESYIASANAPGRVYRGTTETVTTYARQPIVNIDAQTSTNNAIQAGGSATNTVTYSGGWNRTDMSTQTGETWISGSFNFSSGVDSIFQIYDVSDVAISKIAVCHSGAAGVYMWARNVDLTMPGIVACMSPLDLDASNYNITADFGNVMHNRVYMGDTTTLQGDNLKFTARRIEGSNSTGALFTGLPNNHLVCRFSKIDNNSGVGFSGSNAILFDTVFANNTSSDLSVSAGQIAVINGTFTGAPTLAAGAIARYHRYGGAADDHRVFGTGFNVVTDATTRHTASGIAWKINVTEVTQARGPKHFPLGRFAVAASALVTVKAWVRRTSTDLGVGIKVRGGFVAGVASDVTAECTAAIDTWQEITLTFTPTEAGVLELLGYAYSTGTTHSGWWDDLTITQA